MGESDSSSAHENKTLETFQSITNAQIQKNDKVTVAGEAAVQ